LGCGSVQGRFVRLYGTGGPVAYQLKRTAVPASLFRDFHHLCHRHGSVPIRRNPNPNPNPYFGESGFFESGRHQQLDD